MKNKHGTITTLTIALLLVLINAAVLPHLLALAQALPEGEVVAQVIAPNGERLPLPEVPEGFDGYELIFSRPLTEDEQQRWDRVPLDNPASYLESSISVAPFVYTQRASERLREALRVALEDGSISYEPEMSIDELMANEYRIGEAQPGECQIDIGQITIVLPDEIDDKAMVKLYRATHPYIKLVGELISPLDEAYRDMYSDYVWTRPDTVGSAKASRGLCPEESARYEAIWEVYVYEGLRASTPLLLSKPAEDAMWYDEQVGMLHLPTSHQLTDDELLQHLELFRTLSAKVVLGSGINPISEQEALERAEHYIKLLFGFDIEDYVAYTLLNDESRLMGNPASPEWFVSLMPARRDANAFVLPQFRLILSAEAGSLLNAWRVEDQPLAGAAGYSASNKPTFEVREAWREMAKQVAERAFPGSAPATRADFQGYFYGGDQQETGLIITSDWIVRMADGSRCYVYLSTDGELDHIHFYPK